MLLLDDGDNELDLRWFHFIRFVDVFFFQAEDGIRDRNVTGVQTCALPISSCWEQQGFGGYNYGRDRVSDTNPLANEQGKYRLQFEVPASWKGKIVRLVFDG